MCIEIARQHRENVFEQLFSKKLKIHNFYLGLCPLSLVFCDFKLFKNEFCTWKSLSQATKVAENDEQNLNFEVQKQFF